MPVVWSLLGFALSLCLAAAAWLRTTALRRSESREKRSAYDLDVYGMTAKTHLRYALTGLVSALYFAVTYVLHQTMAAIAGLTLFVLIAIVYATSFLRGASESDE